jgi:hypothetical protein
MQAESCRQRKEQQQHNNTEINDAAMAARSNREIEVG